MNKKTNEKEILFFTYGTLKQNYGNYNAILKDKSEFLGTFSTEPNYTMYDGGFPIVEREGNTSIIGELHKTSDPQTIDRVFSLEGCHREQNHPNSWYTYDIIETPYGQAIMFVMDKGTSKRNKIVETGNWSYVSI
jgi:gamma-glutamylcyclotransferase (GGCT)/AIG2-like uncharacterized protein YtfP